MAMDNDGGSRNPRQPYGRPMRRRPPRRKSPLVAAIVFVLFALLVLAGAFLGPALMKGSRTGTGQATWTPIDSAEGRYHADFPDTPTETSKPLPPDSVVHITKCGGDGGLSYGVTWFDVLPAVLASLPAVDTAVLARYESLETADFGTIRSARDSVVSGRPARDVAMVSKKTGAVYRRIYIFARPRMYMVTAGPTPVDGTDERVERFVNSFQLTP